MVGSGNNQKLGISIAISRDGAILVTGSTKYVRVHRYDGSSWNMFVNDWSWVTSAVNDVSISADGRTIVTGEQGYNGNEGVAYVYTIDSSPSVYKGSPLSGETAGDKFGRSVTVSPDGSVIAIGAAGGRYIKLYDYDGGDWLEREKLLKQFSNGFGITVAMSDDTTRLLAGASGSDQAFIFDASTSPISLLQAFDGDVPPQNFGQGVSMSSDAVVLAVGAFSGDYVKLFRADDASARDSYSQISTNIVVTQAASKFGLAVALSADGSTLVAGQPEADSDTGYARVYRVHEDSYQERKLLGFHAGKENREKFGFRIAVSTDGGYFAIASPEFDGTGSLVGQVRTHARK